jgi:hypothetical protein
VGRCGKDEEEAVTARPDFPYRKLPGARHGIISGASLWLGIDHILHVKNTRFAEDYRRYYFSDIQAIYLQRTARFAPPPLVVIAVILGLLAILVLSITRHGLAVELGWIFLLFLSAYAAWLCMFRSCICSIQTALGTDRLSCLHRVTAARAAVDRISDHVLTAQGGVQEDVPEQVEATPQPLEHKPPRSREQLFGWLTLPFILLSSVLVMRLPLPIPDTPFAAALGAILAAVILAVLALIAGRGGRFRAVQGALLVLTLLCGLELYGLILVNTYSQPIHIGRTVDTPSLTQFAWAAHMGSIWVAGANIAAAFVTAALLLRNQPSRSNP